MYLRSGLCDSVPSMRACVRKCAGIPLSAKKMKGREQEVVLKREIEEALLGRKYM